MPKTATFTPTATNAAGSFSKSCSLTIQAPNLHPVAAPSISNGYTTPDDDAIRTIVATSRKIVPDATIEEIVHFIHEKGQTLRSGKIGNPLAHLIVYVPTCFQRGALGAFREEMHVERDRPGAGDSVGDRRSALRQTPQEHPSYTCRVDRVGKASAPEDFSSSAQPPWISYANQAKASQAALLTWVLVPSTYLNYNP